MIYFSSSLQQFYCITCLIVGTLSFVLLPWTAEAHRITEADWKEGVVILNDDQVLSGDVYFDHLHDLVLLRPEAHQPVKTFTVHQVQSFRYYDIQDNVIHDFVALDRSDRSSYQISSFYEVVTRGEVLYLRRRNRCPLDPPQGVNPHVVAYDYFAYYQGQLVRSHQFEKTLLPALAEADPSLRQYLKESHLKPYDIGDQIRLVERFNQHAAAPIAGLSAPQ